MENTKNIPIPPELKFEKIKGETKTYSNQPSLQEEIEKKSKLIHKYKIKIYKGINYKSSHKEPEKGVCDYCNKNIEKSILKMHKESHPSRILDWLYLGSYNNATNKQELKYANIKFIINCAIECKNLFQQDFIYKHFELSDIPNTRIIDHFEEAFKVFEEARLTNSVLFVHCMMGKSRSATLVIAYLMKYCNMPFVEAYKFVKTARQMAFPNLGFIRQLKEYDQLLFKGKKEQDLSDLDSIKENFPIREEIIFDK